MLYSFNQLEHRTDEDALLYLIKELAEEAIKQMASQSLPSSQIQPSDIHVYCENGDYASPVRTWLVTATYGDRFIVRVSLDQQLAQRQAVVLHWETSRPVPGIFYLKQRPALESQSTLDDVYNDTLSKSSPVGHARLVGRTLEQIPRPVYWLYEGKVDSVLEHLRPNFHGEYLLIERHFIRLPPSLEWHLLNTGGTS